MMISSEKTGFPIGGVYRKRSTIISRFGYRRGPPMTQVLFLYKTQEMMSTADAKVQDPAHPHPRTQIFGIVTTHEPFGREQIYIL